ncbi:MAG: DNA alkylation repair protein [Gemmatimonadaceae bacterium]|nr:DNA alkylation repair protein [Gemmatimonadaceae bacterium]
MTSKGVAPYDAPAVVAWLKRNATKATRDGMARFGIPSDHALGVTMSQLKTLAKLTGRNHALAEDLWSTGIYEARLLAALIDDPSAVTSAQMDRWCKDFDNWGIADTVCFALFDRTEHRWEKVTKWATRKPEFEKRAAFALLWGLTVHDKSAPDSQYLGGLALIERAAADDRHFVKKAVNMALRAVGKRNRALNVAAVATAKALAASDDVHAQWIGRDALRELQGPVVARRISR